LIADGSPVKQFKEEEGDTIVPVWILTSFTGRNIFLGWCFWIKSQMGKAHGPIYLSGASIVRYGRTAAETSERPERSDE